MAFARRVAGRPEGGIHPQPVSHGTPPAGLGLQVAWVCPHRFDRRLYPPTATPGFSLGNSCPVCSSSPGVGPLDEPGNHLAAPPIPCTPTRPRPSAGPTADRPAGGPRGPGRLCTRLRHREVANRRRDTSAGRSPILARRRVRQAVGPTWRRCPGRSPIRSTRTFTSGRTRRSSPTCRTGRTTSSSASGTPARPATACRFGPKGPF